MTTVETKVYAYAELSENAKEKAREWYANGDWRDSKDTIDACKEAIKLLGIDAEHIYFRGFNSQAMERASSVRGGPKISWHGKSSANWAGATRSSGSFATTSRW